MSTRGAWQLIAQPAKIPPEYTKGLDCLMINKYKRDDLISSGRNNTR